MKSNSVSLYQSVSVSPSSADEQQFRFVDKNGRVNVTYSSMGEIKNMHANIYLFIVQADWWLVLTLVLFGFVASWFVFAFLYFLISIEHGDISWDFEDSLTDNVTSFDQPTDKETCVKDVHNFLSALLFSIETQHTIGYGSRYITTECIGGILVLTLQSTLGYLLQVIFTQIVFTKLSRPTEKSQFVVFSRNALIAPRDDKLTFTFRIGNLSVSQLISASVRLLMIHERKTTEGEVIHHQIDDMPLTHLRNGQLFFPRPAVIEHVIDSHSPLYGIQRDTLKQANFEIIAIIEGAFDHTGFSCHFRTSYVPDEIIWGYRFTACDSTLEGFDYEKFDNIQLVDVRTTWNHHEAETINENFIETPIDTSHSKPTFDRPNNTTNVSNNEQRMEPSNIDKEIDS